MKADPAFLVEFGLLLLALGAAGALALRVGLSAVPLFLIAGLAIGEGGILHAPSAGPFLDLAAGIGVVLLMLTLGLEFSSSEFTDALRRHGPSGLVDLVLNATPGLVCGLILDLPAAGTVALAGITWISSSGIVARVLTDLGRLGYRETPAVLSILVLEDIAMAAYLPILGVLLVGVATLAGFVALGVALIAVALVFLLSARLGNVLERLLSHDSDEQVMLRVLGITLLVAGAAEYLGVSSAVGAFLVGLATPGQTATTARRVLAPLRDLFAASFFVSFGYNTDPARIPETLPAAAALALVTAVTKVVTGAYAAGRDGVGRRGRLRAGTVLIARGEFSIVIAGLAVVSGASGVGPLATGYVLLLGIAGPVLARTSDSVIGALGGRRRAPPPA